MSKQRASRPISFKDRVLEKLRDPAYASAYLNEAMLEGDEVVLKVALADVIRARGVGIVAKKAGINRVTVNKTLKPETRTSFTTMNALLSACDINLSTQPIVNISKIGRRRLVSAKTA